MTRDARDAFGRLEAELQQERTAALRRIGRTLEDLIRQLEWLGAALAGSPPGAQDPLREEYARIYARAQRWRWYLEVQREAVGLRRHDRLDELYPIPPLLEPATSCGGASTRAAGGQPGSPVIDCGAGGSHIHEIDGRYAVSLRIGDTAPDFEASTTEGRIRFHEWLGNSWGVIFSHPKDFTPVCTTELGYMARLKPEFDRRHVKVIGLSVDPVDNHTRWAEDIRETQGYAPNYPMIGDTDLSVSKLYGMLPADLEGTCDGRTAADNQTVRNVFVIGPDKKIKLIVAYPMSTGRNFDEILRVIDSLQLTATHKVATPVNWQQGDDVIILGSVTDEEARKTYPAGWKAPRPYLRIVPQPGVEPV